MNRQVICISKINSVLVENAEDLDILMPMYNLLKYSKNYSKTPASLWNYYRDELTDETNDNNGPNKNVINSKSFKYKASITGSTYNVPRRINGDDGIPADNPNYDQNELQEKFKLLCHKTSGQFLEQFKYAINQLRSVFVSKLVLCDY